MRESQAASGVSTRCRIEKKRRKKIEREHRPESTLMDIPNWKCSKKLQRKTNYKIAFSLVEMGDLYTESGHTLQGSFSAVSRSFFATALAEIYTISSFAQLESNLKTMKSASGKRHPGDQQSNGEETSRPHQCSEAWE